MVQFGLFLFQIISLFIINEIGNFIVSYFNLFIPGSIVGISILFMLLWSGMIKLSWIEKGTDFLLKHLAFFFIPFALSIITFGDMFIKGGFSLMLALMVSTILGLVVTAFVFNSFKVRVKDE